MAVEKLAQTGPPPRPQKQPSSKQSTIRPLSSGWLKSSEGECSKSKQSDQTPCFSASAFNTPLSLLRKGLRSPGMKVAVLYPPAKQTDPLRTVEARSALYCSLPFSLLLRFYLQSSFQLSPPLPVSLHLGQNGPKKKVKHSPLSPPLKTPCTIVPKLRKVRQTRNAHII